MRKRLIPLVAAPALMLFAVPSPAAADHAWSTYHWARTNNPFTLQLGDNVSSSWDGILSTTSADWTQSEVIRTPVVAGNSNPKTCRPTSGRVEVCNARYGRTGWLGVAQVWVSGSHITQGVAKLNDTYFDTAAYNSTAWRNLVMCQEVGHTLGLDHQDEAFGNDNLGTCMDYTSDPDSNQHPNAHDYDQLAIIYQHGDTTTTVAGAAATAASDTPPDLSWGQEIRRSADGRLALFVRELGGGQRMFTFVIWAQPRR